jgi:Uma2 family endonuclease
MSLQPKPGYTFDDYLAAEREEREVRHELIRGKIFAMVGTTAMHSLIAANIIRDLGNQTKGRPCLIFSTDLRLRIEAADACTYPDVMALCGETQLHDDRRDVLLNPSLIIEVLSPSTEAYDRGGKFAIYRRLPSLREYLLVSQDKPATELYVRQTDGRWLLSEHSGPDAEVPLPSVDCCLSLREIYDKVVFPEYHPTVEYTSS